MYFWWVKETRSPQDISFMHPKHMFDRNKLIIIIFWGVIYLCLLPDNSNFQYFEIKSILHRNSNLLDFTVFFSRVNLSNLVKA